MVEDTFPKLLSHNCRQCDDGSIALRKKEYGIWREYTWKDCYQKAKGIFHGLVNLGLEAGDRVSILSDSTPEWFWSELAVQAAGGSVIGLSPAGSADEARVVLGHSQSKFVLAQDQEQVDKLLECKDGLPSLQRIVCWNGKGMRHYEDPILVSLSEMVRLGEAEAEDHPGQFEECLSLGRGQDLALIFYSPGSDGHPRHLPASYDFMLASLRAVLASNPVSQTDEYVSIISPGWFYEQTLGFAASLVTGQKLNFAERMDTAPQDLREISPHVLLYPAQVWDNIASAAMTNVRAGRRLNKALFNLGLSIGYGSAGLPDAQSGLPEKIRHGLAEYAVFRPLRDKHGLNRSRVAYAVGEPSTETTQFFRAVGIHLETIFGSMEEGIISAAPDEQSRIE